MGNGIYFKVNEANVNSSKFQKVLIFQIPAPSPIRIIDISLHPNSTFAESGKFSLVIGGQTNNESGQPLPTALSIPAWSFQNEIKLSDGRKVKGLILNPGDTIEILASCSSGTGVITAEVTGEIL